MAPVRGFADLHSHPMAHRGFGGKVVAGAPFAGGGVAQALQRCDGPGQPHNVWDSPLVAFFAREAAEAHGPCGMPSFADWPTSRTLFHQQMYVDWVKRAYVHGLRVLCCVVVNNELLAQQFGAVRYSDFNMLDAQLDALGDFVAYVHQCCDDAGVPRWLGLARNPAEARALISQNQLALVIGVELDALDSLLRHTGNDEPHQLGWHPSVPVRRLGPEPVQATEVETLLSLLRARGVSMITPMHLTDNGFGGCAIYDARFDLLNRWARGEYFTLERDPSVQFQLRDSAELLVARLAMGLEAPRYDTHAPGHVNAKGLSPVGRAFVQAAMAHGFLLDVEHMSSRSVDEVLALAKAKRYPLLASHGGFRELGWTREATDDAHAWSTEAMKTRQQAEDILALGGVLGALGNQHHVRPCGTVVANTQPGTSRTWAQTLLYGVERHATVGRGGIAIGTDFNGLAGQPGPRYALGQPLDALAVHYDDPAFPAYFSGQPLDRLRLPGRARDFDFNVDGLAHYGLLPDFFEDLRRVGVPGQAMDTLFNSAEAFLQCWEACAGAATA